MVWYQAQDNNIFNSSLVSLADLVISSKQLTSTLVDGWAHDATRGGAIVTLRPTFVVVREVLAIQTQFPGISGNFFPFSAFEWLCEYGSWLTKPFAIFI
jgi:hypothetical protein